MWMTESYSLLAVWTLVAVKAIAGGPGEAQGSAFSEEPLHWSNLNILSRLKHMYAAPIPGPETWAMHPKGPGGQSQPACTVALNPGAVRVTMCPALHAMFTPYDYFEVNA
ncbi:unnamed protein product [Gadus morhua 'NCC']